MGNSTQRTVLLNMSSGSQVSVQEILEAIQVLEKQKSTENSQTTLAGSWFLLWTSGTKKYQESSKAFIKPISKTSSVIQRFDIGRSWIENEVRLPLRKAQARQEGFLMKDQRRIAQKKVTVFEVSPQ